MGEEEEVLTRCDASSLVMDRLGDQAGSQGVTVEGFYFDYAAQKEQSPANMLGAVLKQVMRGVGEVPEEISRAYEDQEQVIGGRAPQLPDIVKMVQKTVSVKRTFICIDALDECMAKYRVKILDSLDQILRGSPGYSDVCDGKTAYRGRGQEAIIWKRNSHTHHSAETRYPQLPSS